MTQATGTEAPQAGLSVVVQHEANGVLIHVTGAGSCQSGVDTESVVAFLSAIDPEQLEKDALEALGLLDGDGESSFTKALLNRLIQYAGGTW